MKKYPVPWHFIDVDQSRPFSEVPTTFYAQPSSIAPVCGLYRRYDDLMAEHDVAVVLTGVGGDGVLIGDSPEPHFLADHLQRLNLPALWSELRRWQQQSPQQRSLTYWFSRNVARPLVDYLRGRSIRNTASPQGLPPWIRRDYARQSRLADRGRSRRSTKCRRVGEQAHWEILWNIGLFSGAGREQYPTSFEYRNPLLDRRLVEFMFSVPWHEKLDPDEDRTLQRRALRGILPEKIRTRRGKLGPQQAFFEGLREARSWIDLLTTRPRIVERGYVDKLKWREAVSLARFGQTHSMRHFLASAMLEIWLQQLESMPWAFLSYPAATV